MCSAVTTVNPSPENRRQKRAGLGLQGPQRDMRDQQRIRRIDEHVQPLPDRRRQIVQPEIVTGRRHQKQNQQREEAERLKREVGQAAVARYC